VLLAAPVFRWPIVETGPGQVSNLAGLRAINYPPVASVVLGFRREDVAHPLDGFGMLIPAAEGFSILGTLFSSSLFPGRAPAGHVTLTSYVGGMRAPELALRPPDELVAMTVKDLGVLLGARGRPTFQHTVLYPKAIPQYEVGYGRFKDTMTTLEQEAPGLFFAGHYRDGISLGDSMLSALGVAERMADHVQGLAGKVASKDARFEPQSHGAPPHPSLSPDGAEGVRRTGEGQAGVDGNGSQAAARPS
jgi:oxygen-dependent protoporphyrinogen oxidase